MPRETIPTPPPAVEGFTPSPGVWEPDYSQMDPAQLKVFNAVRQAEGQPPIIPEEGWKAHRADAPTSESTAGTEIPATPTAAAKRLSPGAADAKALSDKLGQWDFTPKEAQGMNEKGWAKLAFDSGVKLPSAAVRKGAIFNVIKARQGPPRTVGQLIQRFRTIGEDMQQTGKD